MLDIPEDYEDLGLEQTVMSNCDREIDNEVAEILKSGAYYAPYTAWDFYGKVWWTGEQWACKVLRYTVHVDTVIADSLQELMNIVSDRWGWK